MVEQNYSIILIFGEARGHYGECGGPLFGTDWQLGRLGGIMVEYNYSNIRIFKYFGPEIQYSYSFVEVSVFQIYLDIRSDPF